MKGREKMRITTWNVNGIRAVVNKDGFAWLDEVKPDILGLQEIKANKPRSSNKGHTHLF